MVKYIWTISTHEKERIEKVKKAMASIEKTVKGIKIFNMGSWDVDLSVKRIWSGSYKLDKITGGGLAEGRIIEIYGEESSGKTTTTLLAAAQATRNKEFIFFIDAEHALDQEYMSKLGVDLNYAFIVQPDYGEQVFDILTGAVLSNQFKLIIVDSVAAMTPKAEIEGSAEDTAQIGLHARMMSRGLRNLTPKVSQSNSCLVFINQTRVDIGKFSPYGVPTTTTWGKALRFYSSIRIEAKRGKDIKRGDLKIGQEMKLKTIKNKTFPPFKDTIVNLMLDNERDDFGVDKFTEVFDEIVEKELVGSRGSYILLTGEKVKAWDGLSWKEKLKEYLSENMDQFKFLQEKILSEDFEPLVRDDNNQVIDYIKGNSKKVKTVEKTEKEQLAEPNPEVLAELISNETGWTLAFDIAVEKIKEWETLGAKELVWFCKEKEITLTWAKAKEVVKEAKTYVSQGEEEIIKNDEEEVLG